MSEGAELGAAVERSEARAVLRNDSFRNLLWAAGTSGVGDWVGLFALVELAKTLGGAGRVGALAVSVLMIARVVPTLFFAPLAGVFVDRWDRKRTMMVTDVIRGTVMLGVAFVGDVFGLVVATFLIEVASALFIPAKDAAVPTIVRRDRLVQANQLSMFATYATLPLGALLCAVLIGATERVAAAASLVARFPDAMAFLAERPEAVPIILNAVSFYISIVFLRRMDVPDDHVQAHEARDEQPSILDELRGGIEFIAGKPLIRALVVGIMAAFFAAGVVIGVGTFFATILNAGDTGFATLGFIVGVGLAIGIIGAGPASERVAKERLFAPGVGVAGVALVVAALMPNLWLVALPALVMGIGAGVAFILGYTMLQEYSTNELRGRVFASFNTAVRLALFTSLVVGPAAIFVLGFERSAEDIEQGTSAVEDAEQIDQEATYPYQVGGVRQTLIGAGLLALGGAVWTGSSLAQVLRRREEDGTDGPARARASTGPGGGPPELDRGVLIVLEGGEGAGKSTQLQLLRDVLADADVDVVVTREPGGTPTGEAVREVLLDADGEVAPRTEALLYAAARAQHVRDVLRPAVEAGRVVLCDRFVDSSIVYQGEGRGLGTGIVADLNRWATDELVPDLTVLLDLPAEEGLQRAREVDEPDRLEAAGLEFHQRVNAAFRRWAAREPERYLVLDAREPAEELHAAIVHRLRRVLPTHAVEALDAAAPEPPPVPVGPVDPRGTQPIPEGPLQTSVDGPVVEGPPDPDEALPDDHDGDDGGHDEDAGVARPRSEALFEGFRGHPVEESAGRSGSAPSDDDRDDQSDDDADGDAPATDDPAIDEASDDHAADGAGTDGEEGRSSGSVPAWLTLPIEDPDRS